MKSLIKDLLKSRLFKYFTYGTLYFLGWKLFGFELVMIIIGSTILGELEYQYQEKDNTL